MNIRRPLILVSIVFAAVFGFAQGSPYGPAPFDHTSRFDVQSTVRGVVRDLTGRTVANARVEVQESLTGRVIASASSAPNGSFELMGLPAGEYQLVTFAGLAQASSHIDTRRDIDIEVRIASQKTSDVRGTTAVSVAQMKVPGNARKLFDKAMSSFRAARLDDAFGFVQRALGVFPDYAQALALRGILNMQKGDNAKAQPDLEKSVELDYADDTNYVALASLYNTEGRYDDAMRILDRGIALHPNAWQALTEMARAQLGKRDYEGALKSLVKTDRIMPVGVHYPKLLRAKAYAGMKDVPAAIAQIETFLREQPAGPNSESAKQMLQKLQEYSGTVEAKK